MSPLLRKTLRDLARARWRTVGIAMLVAIGVGLVSGGERAGAMMRDTLTEWRADLRAADVEILCPPLPPERVMEAFPVEGVAATTTRLVLPAGIEREDRAPLPALVRGIPAVGQPEVNRLHLLEGRMPRDGERAAVIDRSLVGLLGLRVGSEITLALQDRRATLPIVGVALSAEHLLRPTHPELPIPMPGSLGVVFLPPAAMYDLVPTDRVTSLGIRYEKGADPQRVQERILSALTIPVSEVILASQQPDLMVAVMATAPFDVYMPLISVVQALICLLLLAVALARVVEQDRVQMGVLLALGYRRRHLFATLLVQGLAPVVLGILLGTLAHGLIATSIFGSYAGELGYPPPRDAGPPSALVWQGLLYLGVGLLASLTPALAASREKITVMLRPRWSARRQRGGAGARLLDRVVEALHVPLSLRMGAIGTLRRYRSTIGALLGIGASFTVLLAITYVHVTHRWEIDESIRRWNPDTTVHFEHPVDDAALAALAERTEGEVEPCLSRVFLLAGEGSSMWCRVLGVDLGGESVKLRLSEGRLPAAVDAQEMVIDGVVAHAHGLALGSRVTCFAQADAPEGMEVEIVGVLDGLSLGLAVLPLETARELAGLAGLSTTAFVRTALPAETAEARAWVDPRVQTVLSRGEVLTEVSSHLSRTDVIMMWGLVGAALVTTMFLGVLSSLDARDRGPEMVMLQALGWRDRSLWAVGVTEAVGRGLMAILLGGIGGPILAYYLLAYLSKTNHYRLTLIVPGWILLGILLVSLVFLPLGAVPALRAIRGSRLGRALREMARD